MWIFSTYTTMYYRAVELIFNFIKAKHNLLVSSSTTNFHYITHSSTTNQPHITGDTYHPHEFSIHHRCRTITWEDDCVTSRWISGVATLSRASQRRRRRTHLSPSAASSRRSVAVVFVQLSRRMRFSCFVFAFGGSRLN